MKTLKNILFLTLLFGFILSSCEIDKSVNVDPNAISEENVKTVNGIYSLFVALQVNVGDTYSRDRSRINSIWSWQMCAPPGIARAQPVQWNEYFMNTDGPTDDYWVITYRGVKIANDLITYTPDVLKDQKELAQLIVGVAKTYKAFLLGEAACTYGSIPVTISGSTPPNFVSQEDAYKYVQTTLDEAIAEFNKGTIAFTRDLNLKGDKDKWIAVANSLKARFYLHVGNYSSALTAATNGIKDASGSIYGFYSDNTGEHAQWGMWVLDEAETIRGEKTFVDLLKSEAGDKRLEAYFSPNSDGEYYGFAVHDKTKYSSPVDTNELKVAACVRMKKYSTYAEKFPLIRYEENVLIKAECEARGGQIPAAVTDINIIRKQAGLADFSGTNPVAVVTEALKQKYLELYLEGQAWFDMRRVGALPDYKAALNARWIYGSSEKNANPNVPVDNDVLCKWVLSSKYGGLLP